MRGVGFLVLVSVGGIFIARIANRENWLGDQPGLVVIIYLCAVLLISAMWMDARSSRR